jgi:hypothetical protein
MLKDVKVTNDYFCNMYLTAEDKEFRCILFCNIVSKLEEAEVL